MDLIWSKSWIPLCYISLFCLSFFQVHKKDIKYIVFRFIVSAPVSAGLTGQVADTFLQKLNLDRSQKDKYPVVLMKVMTRYAENLVWLNNTRNAQAVFEFIADLATGRDEDLEKCKMDWHIYWILSFRILHCQKITALITNKGDSICWIDTIGIQQ